MEQRNDMEARIERAIEPEGATPAGAQPSEAPAPTPGTGNLSVLDLSNQVAILGETIHELERDKRLLDTQCRHYRRVINHLKATIGTYERCIISQAETNAELREQMETLREVDGDFRDRR
jgi:hypothetical protein